MKKYSFRQARRTADGGVKGGSKGEQRGEAKEKIPEAQVRFLREPKKRGKPGVASLCRDP